MENVKPSYLNDIYIREKPHLLYRFDEYGSRFYYEIDELNNPVFYTSVTSKISQVKPLDRNIIEWACNLGSYENYIKELNKRANYGTLIHILYDYIVLNKTIDLNDLEMICKAMSEENHLNVDIKYNLKRIEKSVVGFYYWFNEWKVDPIATEICLRSKKLGLAGALDLVAYITNPKTGAESLTIIDYKTSKQVFESHIIQLYIYRDLFIENFPEFEDVKMANFFPNDFRNIESKTGKPYKFIHQKFDQEYYNYVNSLCLISNPNNQVSETGDKKIINFEGVLSLDSNLNHIINSQKTYALNEKIKEAINED